MVLQVWKLEKAYGRYENWIFRGLLVSAEMEICTFMIHFPILRSLCTNYPHFWKNQKRNLLLSLCTRRYQLTALNNDHCLVKSCDAQRTIPITKLASIFKLLIDVNGIKLLINDVQTMIFCFFQIMLVCLSQL